MKLQKIGAAPSLPAAEEFTFSEKKVQGARVCRCGGMLYIDSPRRYKLYSEGTDEVHILTGCGHFKWARGETPFAAGESFVAEHAGEYEVNGACTFILVRGAEK